MPDHNKQKVGKDLPERKPGGNCIWQRPICPLWTLKVTDSSALSLHCFVLPLTDLYIFSSIQNYSLKKRAQIQLFHKKHANIPLEINLLIVIICFCRAVSIPP